MSVNWANILLDTGIDVPIQKPQFNIQCPFHEDTHASCSINVDKGKWICFVGCGQGSLQTLVQRMLGLSKEDIEMYLMEKTLLFDINMFDEHTPLDNDVLPEVEFPFTKGYVPWWIFDRGFTKEVLKEWDCGVDDYDNLIIPIKDRTSRLVGWVTRHYDRNPKYMYSKGLKKSQVLFGEHKIKPSPFICITEGTLDTMWLDQHGFSSVAILGVTLSRSQQEALIKLPTDELVLCLDNDEAGKIGRDKAMSCLSKSFVVSYIQIPNEYKDVQDIRNKKILNELIESRTFW